MLSAVSNELGYWTCRLLDSGGLNVPSCHGPDGRDFAGNVSLVIILLGFMMLVLSRLGTRDDVRRF